jgi:hypothetical protein
MMAALFGGDIDDLRFFVFGYSHEKSQYFRVTNRLENWFIDRRRHGDFKKYIKPMLADNKDDRPSAEVVKVNIWEMVMWGGNVMVVCPCKDSENE